MSSVLGLPLPTTILGPRLKRPPASGPAHVAHRSRFEVAIVGAGFSGIGMAVRLLHEGIDDFVVIERSPEVGGTWWQNTYPGCRCDTPSQLYSFAFAPNPDWSETYATQPEILGYLRDVADREDVIPHVRFGVQVTGARWDEAAQHWAIATSHGELTARCLISAVGPLSEPRVPDLAGLDRFGGPAFHTARWDHAHDLDGKRVAVVGTGASAVQVVPQLAPAVAQLDVYQRSAAWVPPHPNRPVPGLERELYRRVPAAQRLTRAQIYYERELLVLGWTRWQRPTSLLEAACRAHLRRQVIDPELRRKLSPDYRLGCKRPTPSNTYLPAFNRDNVDLITDPIERVATDAIVTHDGIERPTDAIVLATGFQVTDAPSHRLIVGAGGRTLADVWDGSPEAYLGTTVSGFPNLFLLLGPNTGNLTTSAVLMAESQIEYILSSLQALRERAAGAIEVRPDAQGRFVGDIRAKSEGSVWLTGGCESWYLDRSGRNSTLWPDFSWRYDALAQNFRPADHVFTARRGRVLINERAETIGGISTRLIELDGSGPTLLFVHGLTDCADFWRPSLECLARSGRRAVAVDLPGFGAADRLDAGPVLPQLDAFLDTLLTHVGGQIGEPVIVVGHSMGGALALRLAGRADDHLLGVVAAPPVGLDWTPLHTLAERTLRLSLAPIGMLPGQLRRRLVAELWRTVAVADRGAPPADFLAAYSTYFSGSFDRYVRTAQSVLHELRSPFTLDLIKLPLLLIWGERDTLAPVSAAPKVLESVAGSRLATIPDCGHCPAIEFPRLFATMLAEFSDSLTQTTRTPSRQRSRAR